MDDLIRPVPAFLGIPTYFGTILFGFLNALEGSLSGGLLSACMTIMGGIFMFYKIRGQHLDNVKKQLEINRLKDQDNDEEDQDVH